MRLKASKLVLCIFVSLCSNGIAASQSRKGDEPPDFFVQLRDHRLTYYHDEDVTFSIFHVNKPSPGPGCHFGGNGQTMQVIKNGHIIRSERVGPVQAADLQKIQGRDFAVTTSSFGLDNGREDDNQLADEPGDAYQIRFTCGQEVSQPSKPFHFSLWNQPVGGLTVLVQPTKSAYRLNETIIVTVEMRNVGKQSVWCPVPLPDDGRSRNFWILEYNWDDPRPTTADNVALDRSLRLLRPGASRKAVFRLNDFRGVYSNKSTALGTARGTYRLRFSVWNHVDDEDIPAKYRKNLWREELTSNDFTIVIK